MFAFLVCWNPKRAVWAEREKLLRKLEKGESANVTWGITTKAIQTGDRIFFIRLGQEPKGVFASGHATNSAYKAPHWSEEKRKQGKMTWHVDVALDQMVDIDAGKIVLLSELSLPPFNRMKWTLQGSGKLIPPEIALSLERRWST